jgi:hypothetical protein
MERLFSTGLERCLFVDAFDQYGFASRIFAEHMGFLFLQIHIRLPDAGDGFQDSLDCINATLALHPFDGNGPGLHCCLLADGILKRRQ